MDGPSAAAGACGSAPAATSAETSAVVTPLLVPSHPACAAPIGPSRAATSTGTQSAAATLSSTPARSVHIASATGHRSRGGGGPPHPPPPPTRAAGALGLLFGAAAAARGGGRTR